MNIDKPVSTFEAFCGIIADRARTNGDFALLLTEGVPECAELAAIPEDKIVMRDAPAHSALLRAAGLALSGVKPWVLGRSLELMGGSYAHIREAVAMPALPSASPRWTAAFRAQATARRSSSSPTSRSRGRYRGCTFSSPRTPSR